MLDTQFERFLGDIGNPDTWPFPVSYQVVTGVSPAHVVNLLANDVVDKFKDAASALIERKVVGITTTCGFLGLYQSALAEHCTVPVATSSLLQIPLIEQLLPPTQRVGILTYDETALSAAHLQALQVATDTPIEGIAKDSLFYQWIMHGLENVQPSELLPDVLLAARELQRKHPEIGAIVCECTNLSPFVRQIRNETGLPVYDMLTLMHWFRAGLTNA